ncbi:MAG: molybdopterin-dependent oxidoreductase, partial [Actinomycetota bacterium]
IARRLAGPDRNVTLVGPADPAALPSGGDFPEVDGISPEVTSAEDHYIVDIDLVKPLVEAAGWTLTVKGLIANEMKLTFTSLQERYEVVEDLSVLTCISNEVGGPLVGHSAWGGVRLRDVLEEAEPLSDVVDVVFTAADGYKDSIPLEAAMDPSVILAVSQNGEPLTQGHGFPCRVRVPAIYGMKNVKWLRSIELVARDYKGYWMQRGWSDEAIVRTQSRIDVPDHGQTVREGQQMWIAGVAWAGERGVDKVEVSVDGGETWNEAELKRPAAENSWRLWAYRWTPETDGTAVVMCRATDGTGVVQTTRERPPHPSGASGLHTIEVAVE